ncbi:MAG: cobyrinate a,c-diamide synthase [Sulfuricurvum sp.]
MVSLCISAIASNQGKTILSSALLYHFKDSVRPFKAGPDFIDPQFHTKICGTQSINLDGFMMNPKQLTWLYNHYSDKEVSILEGVMGFYDGMDKHSSAYDISKLLHMPTLLVLDGSGSYITVSAVLKGLKTYKKGNTIKGVVLNRIASQGHYELIKAQIEKDFSDIAVLGWIPNNLLTLKDTHLGLDLDDMDKLEAISKEVLTHIDIEKIKTIGYCEPKINTDYPFKLLVKMDQTVAVVTDENLSFLYHDNLRFLQETYTHVQIIRPSNDEVIPENCSSVYICGGYAETEKAYASIKKATNFRDSLIKHAKNKKIYAECAGLLYLGKNVDEKIMSGILEVSFTLEKRFQRLGYYFNELGTRGHAFHYTRPLDTAQGFDTLSKSKGGTGTVGSWQSTNKKVFGTYLHVMFRSNPSWIKKRL